MSADPRVIAVAFEDLLQEIGVWSATAGQTLAAAYYAQRQARETAERAFHWAAVVIDEAHEDEERVTKIISEADAIVDQGETGRSTANDTLEQARAELNEATSTLEFWEDELRKALAWLERAEARLARAIDEYERARRAFEQGQWSLDQAESRYRACMNNRDRTNCNSEAKAVHAAQEELQRAAYQLQMAEAEVIAAREEVAAARARVQCCSKAVHYSTEAVHMAREAESQAEQAVNSVERGLEFARAAEQNAEVAKAKVIEEITAAEAMLTLARDALSTTDAAAMRLADADGAEESSQRYATGGRHELEYRLRLLHQINTPDLYASAVAVAGGSGLGISATSTGGRSAAWTDLGIKFVNVADLQDSEGVSGEKDFRKISESDMRSGIERLQKMKPVIESGAGANADYWADYDKKHGLDFSGGYQRVYEAFYGPDCIKVNKDKDTYDIDNGRHRIWLAKQMGVKQLPMKVVERRSDE